MLGLGHYGSDSEDESPQPSTSKQPIEQQKQPKKAPKRIAIGLPSLPKDDKTEEGEQDQPPAKKPRLNTGANKSSLLSMLPAPKKAQPTPAAPQRVLGGGQRPGLDFTSRPSFTPPAPEVMQELEKETDEQHEEPLFEEPVNAPTPSTLLVPPSLRKGRPNISLEEPRQSQAKSVALPAAPAVDFFSLGELLYSDLMFSYEPVTYRLLQQSHSLLIQFCASLFILRP
jgi:hypothetical protein